MHNEQIFTPNDIVKNIFEELEYTDYAHIRRKHIIDNSCGDGAFLIEIVNRYIDVCISKQIDKDTISNELETYIHGIEIDKKLYEKTLFNLDSVASNHGLFNVKWDIILGDAMDVDVFYNRMDYVVGNPPYCNVHDLGDRYEKVKTYKFANGGMTDLYLVFFEIGIRMLNANGKLGYITPNSWLTSRAAVNFRNYLHNSKTLLEIYQYGHKKVFSNANTYCCLTFLSKVSKENNIFICYQYDENGKFKQTLKNLDECLIGGSIYLLDNKSLKILRDINDFSHKVKSRKNRITVKNGFATLNDKLFIIDNYVSNNGVGDNIIKAKKASNGEEHYLFYPYDDNGKPLALDNINVKLLAYLRSKAIKMETDTSNLNWCFYGRTQALNDVKYDKIIVNNLIRNKDDIKIETLKGNEGVYSGFYIPLYGLYNDEMRKSIIECINSEGFVSYVKAIGKYKNGGYYTFSSKELENWINYCIFKINQY